MDHYGLILFVNVWKGFALLPFTWAIGDIPTWLKDSQWDEKQKYMVNQAYVGNSFS
jgi:hypothetical protein